MNVPLELQTTILWIAAAFNFLLSLLIYLTAKEKSGRILIGLSLAVGIWATGIGFYIREGINEVTYLISYLNYITGIVIGAAFFFFSYYLNSEYKKISPILSFIVIGLATITAFAVSFGYVVLDIIEIEEGTKKEIFGSLYWLYSLVVMGFFAISLPILYIKYKRAIGVIKRSILLILIGTAYSIFVGVMVNIILPGYFNEPGFIWVGPINSIIYVLFITYAITKHGLWNFKMIATQLFISLTILVLFTEILLSESIQDSSLEIIVLLLVIVSSFFFIKSTIIRVKERERMEKLAKEIDIANKNLQELDVQKSDFVSIASHQLRSPLTIVSGYTSMLIEGAFGEVNDKKQLDILKKIYRACKNLVAMIEGYLDVSKIEKREMTYNFKNIDLKKILKDPMIELEQSAKDTGITLKYENDESSDYPITADKDKILQVVQNVVDNAIKYTPSGGNITVKLSRDKKIGNILLQVIDDGIGISEQMKYRLFEKFSREKGIFKLHTEGRGLGLYVSKQIMEAHRGTIRAESDGLNKGSKFYIKFNDADYNDKRQEIKGFIHEL